MEKELKKLEQEFENGQKKMRWEIFKTPMMSYKKFLRTRNLKRGVVS